MSRDRMGSAALLVFLGLVPAAAAADERADARPNIPFALPDDWHSFHPKRWPAGDPELWKAVGPFGDIDGRPSKDMILGKRDDPEIGKFFRLTCGKWPAEELYDLVNLAGRPEYAAVQGRLRQELQRWMEETDDPRARGMTTAGTATRTSGQRRRALAQPESLDRGVSKAMGRGAALRGLRRADCRGSRQRRRGRRPAERPRSVAGRRERPCASKTLRRPVRRSNSFGSRPTTPRTPNLRTSL